MHIAGYHSFNEIEDWLDIETFAMHFWIQEFSKNPDANYYASVYFTWNLGNKIKMGPVWDFDLAYGGHFDNNIAHFNNWSTKKSYWNSKLFANKEFESTINSYWATYRKTFDEASLLIDSLENVLSKAANNNFKRWNILKEDGQWISRAVSNYKEAIKDMKLWIEERILWIDNNI